MKMRNTRRFRKRTKRNTRRRKNLKGGSGGWASSFGLSGLLNMTTEQKIEALNDAYIKELSDFTFYDLGYPALKDEYWRVGSKIQLKETYSGNCNQKYGAKEWCPRFKDKVADLYEFQSKNATSAQPASAQPTSAQPTI